MNDDIRKFQEAGSNHFLAGWKVRLAKQSNAIRRDGMEVVVMTTPISALRKTESKIIQATKNYKDQMQWETARHLEALKAEFLKDGQPVGEKTVADRLMETREYKTWREKGMQRTMSAQVEGGFFQKSTLTSANVGSATPGVLAASRVSGIISSRRRLTLRDLLPVVAVTSNVAEVVQLCDCLPS